MNTLIKFSAGWCQPCQQMKSAFAKFASEQTDVKIVEIDVDESPDVASNYRVRSIPTILLVDENDNILKMKAGAMTEQELKDFVNGL